MWKKLFGLGAKSEEPKDKVAMQLGIDPDMRYCPQCGDEYRPDIEQCVGCSVALISGMDKLAQAKKQHQDFYSRSMEIGSDEPRVAIRGGKLRDLKPIQRLLAEQRIPAMITGEAAGCQRG